MGVALEEDARKDTRGGTRGLHATSLGPLSLQKGYRKEDFLGL